MNAQERQGCGAVGCLMIVCYLAALGGFGAIAAQNFQSEGVVISTAAFAILGLVGWIGGAIFRKFAQPDWIFASSGLELFKARLFWIVGPQIIGLVLAGFVSYEIGAHFGLKGAAAIRDKAQKLEVSLRFEDTPIRVALQDIYQASRQVDPAGTGVPIRYFDTGSTTPPTVSYKLDKPQTVDNLLQLICEFPAPPFRYEYRDDAIYVFPDGEEPPVTATPAPAAPAPPVAVSSQATPETLTDVQDAKRQAVLRYPDLAVAGSPLNKEFVARYKRYQQERPDYFRDPSWPLRLAEESAQAIK
jgi:hypothetical protein